MNEITINNLPNEMLQSIFEHINLADLFNNLKSVCKRWNSIIDENMKFNELVLIQQLGYFNYWYFSFNQINYHNLIRPINFKIDQSTSFKRNFKNLRFLKINYDTENIKFDFSFFNFFVMLEHFELNEIDNLEQDTIIRLPNLKVFSIVIRSDNRSKLILDAHQLNVVHANNFELIDFFHPESIKSMEVHWKDEINFKKFINLETLRLRRDFGFFYDDILSILPINLHHLELYAKFYLDEDSMKTTLKSILDQRRSKKLDLKISFNAVKLVDTRTADEYGFDLENIIGYHFRNYDFLNEKQTIYYEFDYQKLIDVHQVIRRDFHQKFINIQKIKSNSRIEDQQQFTWFISNCKNLTELELMNSSLTQLFYDELPNNALHLNSFKLFDEVIDLNYEFISNFKKLTYFLTFKFLDFEKVLWIIKKLKYFEEIHFRMNTNSDDEHINVNIYKDIKFISLSFNRNYNAYHSLKFDCINDLFNFKDQLNINVINNILIKKMRH